MCEISSQYIFFGSLSVIMKFEGLIQNLLRTYTRHIQLGIFCQNLLSMSLFCFMPSQCAKLILCVGGINQARHKFHVGMLR